MSYPYDGIYFFIYEYRICLYQAAYPSNWITLLYSLKQGGVIYF